MKCPSCGSSDVRESRHPHMRDFIEKLGGRKAHRCRQCRRRFYAEIKAGASEEPAPAKHSHRLRGFIDPRKKKRLLRRLVVVSIFGVAFLVFWLFLRYLTTEHAPAPDSGVGALAGLDPGTG